MHAVIFQVSIKDREAADAFLKEQIVPGVSQAPGFITGHWTKVGENRGMSMLIFDSEEAARNVADGDDRPPEDVVTVDSVDVGEVVAHA